MSTPGTASNSDARKRAEEFTRHHNAPCEIVPVISPPSLPDTSDWVRVRPGSTIPAGTPRLVVGPDGFTFSQGRYARPVDEGETVLVPPPPAPEPWTLIPEGRENARVLRVNGVVGSWFRLSNSTVIAQMAADGTAYYSNSSAITSVEPVAVVPVELVERARAWAGGAKYVGDAVAMISDLAAVEGGEGQ